MYSTSPTAKATSAYPASGESAAAPSHGLHWVPARNQVGLHTAQRTPVWPLLQLKAVAGVTALVVQLSTAASC